MPCFVWKWLFFAICIKIITWNVHSDKVFVGLRNMKKQIFILSAIVITISVFVSCSVNSGSDDVSKTYISTTAITDGKGTTYYYKAVTDDKGNILTTAKNHGVFVDIETQTNSKVVTKKNGEYITKEHSTLIPIVDTVDNSSITENKSSTKLIKTTAKTSTKKLSDAKNHTTKEPHPATNKDGWITNWY